MRTKKQIKASATKEIKRLIKNMQEEAIAKIDRALNSGAIGDDSEFLKDNSLLPLCLIEEVTSSYQIKFPAYRKESDNIRLFL